VDPLKQQMPVFYLDALSRYRADSLISITQLTKYIASNLSSQLTSQHHSDRWDALLEAHTQRLAKIKEASNPLEDNTFGTGHLCQVLRRVVPDDTIFAIEAVTNTVFVADNIQATLPGTWINCGGGGLGWSGGGALGIKLASEYENGEGKGKFVVQIVGDGTFLFSVPGSVYWISQRYKIPVLTIVLNNKGMSSFLARSCEVHFEYFKSAQTSQRILTVHRMACSQALSTSRPPRRPRLESHKRRTQYLIRSVTRLFWHRKGCSGRESVC